MTSTAFAPLVFLLFSSLLSAARATTFTFGIEEDTLKCDDGTEYELMLKTFQLNCIDGFGCDVGDGIIGAAGCKWSLVLKC